MANIFRPTIIRYTLNGKRVPANTDGAVRKKCRSSKWYGQYTDVDGVEHRVPLSPNKVVAGQMLAALVHKNENAKIGIRDPFEEHHKTPLAKHLDDFEAFLIHKGSSQRHAARRDAGA